MGWLLPETVVDCFTEIVVGISQSLRRFGDEMILEDRVKLYLWEELEDYGATVFWRKPELRTAPFPIGGGGG